MDKKYIFLVDKTTGQKPQGWMPCENGTIANLGYDQFTLTIKQALKVIPMIYPNHTFDYIDVDNLEFIEPQILE
jgi:hypothetical protein